MNLSPKQVRKLVEISFVIEPLLNKDDCTTRLIDLPGKSLYDFIIAGINIGDTIESYAHTVLVKKENSMFSHFPQAIKNSNDFKSPKNINLGLLEYMFVTLKTRFDSNSLNKALDNYIPTLKNTTKQDVLDNLNAHKLALGTSINNEKVANFNDNYEYFENANNIYDLLFKVGEKFPSIDTAGAQAAEQYLKGFPMIRRYVEEIDESKGLIKSLEDTYNHLHRQYPHYRVGILADWCASAMFMFLSFQKPNYIIK